MPLHSRSIRRGDVGELQIRENDEEERSETAAYHQQRKCWKMMKMKKMMKKREEECIGRHSKLTPKHEGEDT